jgi:hypothetical protein
MTVASVDSGGRKRDIVVTTEKQDEGWRISVHEPSALGNSLIIQSRVIYTSSKQIQMIKVTREGGVIVAASEERILLGTLKSLDFGSIDKIRYEFRIFESTDYLCSMDIRVSKRNSSSGREASKLEKTSIVDVVVGDAKGAIFIHNDLLGNLIRSQTPSAEGANAINLIPRKLHWHRKAVNSVKWSLDGMWFSQNLAQADVAKEIISYLVAARLCWFCGSSTQADNSIYLTYHQPFKTLWYPHAAHPIQSTYPTIPQWNYQHQSLHPQHTLLGSNHMLLENPHQWALEFGELETSTPENPLYLESRL